MKMKFNLNLIKILPLIKYVSSLTFGIYCFHDNIYVRKLYAGYTEKICGGGYILFVLGLFTFGLLIELFRCKVFNAVHNLKWIKN